MTSVAKNLESNQASTNSAKPNHLIEKFLEKANSVILDKDHQIKLVFSCILAKGHILIEDLPGMGKTTLVKTFAKLLNLEEKRIQFTNDLLPADLLGSSIFDKDTKEFVFHPGPLFTQLVLADELNRATPKTQSACLQAMEEQQVTIDGVTHSLPTPFFVIATQNPRQTIGTFPLPESQLDRFLMKIDLGFPSREAEKKLLVGDDRNTIIENLEPVFNGNTLVELQNSLENIHASEPLVEYLQDLIEQTRSMANGISPRASINWLKAAKAWALIHGRDYVVPEDIQSIAVPVMNHRLDSNDDQFGKSGFQIASDILESVAVRV